MPFLSDAQHATAIGATIALRSAALRNDAPPVALLQALTATIVDAHTALPDEAHRPLKMRRALVLAHRMRSMFQWRIEQAAAGVPDEALALAYDTLSGLFPVARLKLKYGAAFDAHWRVLLASAVADANADVPQWQFIRGRCIFYGFAGLPANQAAAGVFYRAAAENARGQLAAAQCALGYTLDVAAGVAEDKSAAVALYLSAAQQEHAQALFNTAVSYARGEGVKEDAATAFEYYQRAAEQDLPDAITSVAQSYEHGWGVAVSHRRALELYRRAAELGDADAAYNAAVFLQSAEFDCEHDLETALVLARRADALGNESAQRLIGIVQRRIERGEKLPQRGSDQDDISDASQGDDQDDDDDGDDGE